VNEQTAAAIRAAGDHAQVLRLNRAAALQRRATDEGFTLVGNETEVPAGGLIYVVQKAEHPATGAVHYYYCIKPDYGKVYYLGGA